jgi:sugar O-acyltransferase (sialic acid O-acetyltransferase NeuD family)
MLIAGAGGHAKEVLGIFSELNQDQDIIFFDDYPTNTDISVFNKFTIVKTEQAVRNIFFDNNKFVIGVGSPKLRERIVIKLQNYGGQLCSIISPKANIGQYFNDLNNGLNILTNATITQNVTIGEGCLIHINVTIHHDCVIGKYCEISPSCNILGKVRIGDYCSIGAGAVILPDVEIGNNVIVGAGAVVTKNIGDNQTIKGIPAR